jgi:hypothetical protein
MVTTLGGFRAGKTALQATSSASIIASMISGLPLSSSVTDAQGRYRTCEAQRPPVERQQEPESSSSSEQQQQLESPTLLLSTKQLVHRVALKVENVLASGAAKGPYVAAPRVVLLKPGASPFRDFGSSASE